MKKDKTNLAVIAAVTVYTVWGFSFLASAIAQEVTTPFVLLAYRFDIAAVLMVLPMLFGKKKLSLAGKNIKGLLLLGLMEPCLYFIGEQYGLRFTNSAFSGIIIAMIPIVTLLLSAVMLKERPTRAQWLFSLLSIAGILVITLAEEQGGEVRALGVICLVAAVFTGALCTVLSRKISDDFSTYERSVVMQLMGAVFFTILAVAENHADPAALIEPLRDPDAVLALLYLAVFSSVIGYTLFNFSVANAPLTRVAVLVNLTTVISVIAGVAILGDSLTVVSAVAMAAVLIGIWGVQKY